MDTMPGNDPMENPLHSPLDGLDPADLLRQGVAEDTIMEDASPAFNPPPIEELAPLFPQFEILELIGKGGMGAVYKVRQKDLDRIVALKILPPAIGQSPAFSNRFTREAKALAKLNHPGIVTLHEFGQREGLYFILMEFVDGVNLAQLMKSGRVSPREALAIVPQICDALQFAHDQGIVHRDIKPENILLDRLGRVKVADFGIAKVVAAVCDGPNEDEERQSQTDATVAGKVMGTPQYMAPEQIDHPADVDHRADIYALGVVFYQMLTGELPGKDLQAPSKRVKIDVRLDEIVMQALEKQPELRFQQASVMKTRVEDIALSKPNNSSNSAVSNNIKPKAWRLALIAIAQVLLVYGITTFGIELFRMREAPKWHRITMLFALNQREDSAILSEGLKQSLKDKGVAMSLANESRGWKLSFVAANQDLTENARRAAQEDLVQSHGESLRFLETTSSSSQVANGVTCIGPYWIPYFRNSIIITMLGLVILSFTQPLAPEKHRYPWAGKAGVRCLVAAVILPWLAGSIDVGYILGFLARIIPLGLAVTFALMTWESRIGREVILGAGLLLTLMIFSVFRYVDLSGIPISQGTPIWIAAIVSLVIVGILHIVRRPAPPPLKRGMFRRWWWMFVVMLPLGLLIGLVAGSVWAYIVPKMYEAEAVIEVRRTADGLATPAFFGTQFEVIKSKKLLSEVSDQLDLPNKWMVRPDVAIRILKGIINTQNIRGTDLISIRVRHTSRQDVVEIPNALVLAYQKKFAGVVIVHEVSSPPSAPVSPNITLIFVVSGLGGFVLSPLMALILIPILHRVFPEKKSTP